MSCFCDSCIRESSFVASFYFFLILRKSLCLINFGKMVHGMVAYLVINPSIICVIITCINYLKEIHFIVSIQQMCHRRSILEFIDSMGYLSCLAWLSETVIYTVQFKCFALVCELLKLIWVFYLASSFLSILKSGYKICLYFFLIFYHIDALFFFN